MRVKGYNMDWTQQTHALSNAWLETQQKAWQGWIDMAQSAAQMGVEAGTQTREAAANPQAAADGSVMQATIEQLAASQRAWQQMVAGAMQPWQQMMSSAAPTQTADLGAMTELINGYVEQMREQATAAPASALESWQSLAQNGSQLWQLYQQQMQSFVQPWLQGWQPSAMMNWANLTPDGMSQLANEATTQAWDAYAQAFFPFLDAPTLGLNRELEEKLRRGFKAWLTYNQRTAEYQVGVAEALGNVYTRLGERLLQMAEQGERIESLQALGDLWGEVTDPAFNEVFRSEEFIRTQGALLTATMEYRLQQRGLVELLCGIYDIPTRTEVDAAHKANYEQRKQIKALAKTLNEATAQIEALRSQMGEIERASQRAVSDARSASQALGLHPNGQPEQEADHFSEVF